MKFIEFKKQLDGNEVCPIYLFEGEDAFFKKRGISLLKQKITEPSFNLAVFEQGYREDELLSSLNSFPMLSDKRLTVAYDFYPDTQAIKKIKEYAKSPNPTSILAIVNAKAHEGLKKLDNLTIVNCDRESPSVLSAWIKNECKNMGVTINSAATSKLIEYCLCDMSRIEQETVKVASFVGRGGEVTEGVIQELVTLDVDYKIYEMTDCLGKKQTGKALEIINDMLSRGEPAQKLIFSLFSYFRKLLFVSINNLSLQETAKQLGIKEYPAKIAKEQASKFKLKSLKRAVDLLEDADYLFKSGYGDDDSRMWLALFEIMLGE